MKINIKEECGIAFRQIKIGEISLPLQLISERVLNKFL